MVKHMSKTGSRTSNSSTNPKNRRNRTDKNLRSEGKVKLLNLYKTKLRYNTRTRRMEGDNYSQRTHTDGRVNPSRKWYGNTRTIAQETLTQLRDAAEKVQRNPSQVLLHARKIPQSLIKFKDQEAESSVLDVESYDDAFGPRANAKKGFDLMDLGDLAKKARTKLNGYSRDNDPTFMKGPEFADEHDPIYGKGTSKRIMGELFRVVDSSDVIVQVLDARDPMGTRSSYLESYLKKEMNQHRNLVFLLNKVDLVPQWVTALWLKKLSKEYPTIAFHASITRPFGKNTLLNLLRQYGSLSPRPSITVGFVGYPNVGKSSVINTMVSKRACTVAPVPGQTRVWQFVSLMSRINLIDCPGVVPFNRNDDKTTIVLKGSLRIEQIPDPWMHIEELLKRCQKQYIQRQYGITNWSDSTDFIERFAKKSGKLIGGGQPDLNNIGRIMISDWVRGRLPHFELPDDYIDNSKQKKLTIKDVQPEDAPAKGESLEAPDAYGEEKVAEEIANQVFNNESAAPIIDVGEDGLGVWDSDSEEEDDDELAIAIQRERERLKAEKSEKKKRRKQKKYAISQEEAGVNWRKRVPLREPKDPRVATNNGPTGSQYYKDFDVKGHRTARMKRELLAAQAALRAEKGKK
ncbi:hypothetical protein PCE1_004566 [Barthelona sp. PCE]